MLSNRPYLIRAFYQWIVDSRMTPVIAVNARYPRCVVPNAYVEDGEIVFNISPSAVDGLSITNQMIQFNASFSGIVHAVVVPVKAVLAIYAEENGEGYFPAELGEEESEGDGEPSRPVLKLVE